MPTIFINVEQERGMKVQENFSPPTGKVNGG